MSEGLQLILNGDGVFEEYDDTYDLTIHCESKEEQEKVLKKLNGGWIPCSERLPEAGDTYLVSGVQEIDGEMVPFVDAANYPDSYIDGLWGTFNDWIEGNEVHVLAWQEMPEAWEDEE